MGKGSENKLDEAVPESNGNTTDKKLAIYEWDEIRKHDKKDDLWVVVESNVYNLTRFRRIHPGGDKLLDHYAGQDATVSSPEKKINIYFTKLMAIKTKKKRRCSMRFINS
jgi:fatty acid desaturase 2 (delta-6 desaturase)